MTVFSQNGYVANERDRTATYDVPGTKVKLRLLKGDVAKVLVWLASQYDDQVEDIDRADSFPEDAAPSIAGGGPSKVLDDWGYAPRTIEGSTTVSNHASGTAIDLNATQHPRDAHNTYTGEQKAAVRALLAQLVDPGTGECVVRWGEDFTTRIDGMHFEINAKPEAVARVAATLTLEDDMQLTDTVKLTDNDRETLGLEHDQDASVALLLRRSARAEGKVEELNAKLDKLLAKLG